MNSFSSRGVNLGRLLNNIQKSPHEILGPSVKISCFHTSTNLSGRYPQNKLKKPEDKSQIVLGKRKWNVVHPKEGVSDKTNPILVKWERPVTMETCNPEISGDVGGLAHFGDVDMTQPPVGMQKSKAFENAPEEVKKVLSLEFARRKQWIQTLSHQVIQSVQRHPRDFSSPEVKIASLTIKIRNLQHELIELYPYKNQPMKAYLTRQVTSRRKALEQLRKHDYKKYEWLLEKLNLLYKPMPWDAPKGVLLDKENIARKASIERLTDLWCSELRRHRLKAYQDDLEKQQVIFLRDKAEKLKRILEDEKKLGLELTVTEEQIAECYRAAVDIDEKIKNDINKDDTEDYLIYKEEVKKEEHKYIG